MNMLLKLLLSRLAAFISTDAVKAFEAKLEAFIEAKLNEYGHSHPGLVEKFIAGVTDDVLTPEVWAQIECAVAGFLVVELEALKVVAANDTASAVIDLVIALVGKACVVKAVAAS